MGVSVGCGVTDCDGHPTFVAAYAHHWRTFGDVPPPDPRESEAAAREAVREDEAARNA